MGQCSRFVFVGIYSPIFLHGSASGCFSTEASSGSDVAGVTGTTTSASTSLTSTVSSPYVGSTSLASSDADVGDYFEHPGRPTPGGGRGTSHYLERIAFLIGVRVVRVQD